MVNLRLITVKTIDSTTIRAQFTEKLDPILTTGNIVITSNNPGIPDPEVTSVSVVGDSLEIKTLPLSPYAVYFVKFQSTDLIKFKSSSGNFLFQDDKTNVVLILGPEDPSDSVRDILIGYLKDNVYNIDFNTIVRDLINSQANTISTALHDIRQAKSDNYLSTTIENELHIRGGGPIDRLNEEGAYEIVRVSKNIANSLLISNVFDYDEFPSDLITLQGQEIIGEQLVAGGSTQTFNGLILTVKNNFVTKLKSVIIAYQLGNTFTYDISSYGYQILTSKYDKSVASPYFALENNQFKLNDEILSVITPPGAGDTIIVDYEYKKLGRNINESSVSVIQIIDAIREVAPPLKTVFNLKHAPLVTSNGTTPTTGNISFLDPNSNPPFSDTHPAFTKQITYRFDGLPKQPGEFAIDYSTGNIFVYGETIQDGTGDFPPVMTYKYLKTFSPTIDYTYDPEFSELVANPSRELIGQEASINFSFEDIFVPDIDYKSQIHTEVLDERINNNLISISALTTELSPITNVFRIYNETSGEIYQVQRWNNNIVYFTSNTSPRILDIIRERVAFTDVANETLIVDTEFVNFLNTRVYKIILANNRIMSASEDLIGSSFNSSASFSRTDILVTELYFDSQTLTVTENTDRLQTGLYQIDYTNGIVYIGVSNAQDFDIGTINYKKSTILPQNAHVISVSEVYNSLSAIDGFNKIINYVSFSDQEIIPSTFDLSDERFLNQDITLPYSLDSNTISVSDNVKNVRNIFDHYDLTNNIAPTNFADNATIVGNVITLDVNGVQKQETLIIQSGLVLNATNFTSGANIVSVQSAVRISDGYNLWENPGSFSDYEITLSGSGAPIAGQEAFVTYHVSLNGSSTPIVDYNRGDYFVDYSYLADEILISYEYGDNCLDFRESDTIVKGTEYFVTYKIGALRDALLKNFGSLVNIPILNNGFDTALPRERYRDALKAALQSFTKGPTIPALKSVVSNITHVTPELLEAIFEYWALGISRLYQSDIKTSGSVQLLNGKFDYGVLLSAPGDTITFPVSSNLRLEEGTLESWIIPEWNGLDNDASLTFTINLNGGTLSATRIFIGADSHNPTYSGNNTFTLNRIDDVSPIGLPSAIYTLSTGIFIYYDDIVKRWSILAKDSVTSNNLYSGYIQSSGEVYDVKWIPGLGEINDVKRSGTSKIEFEFHLDAQDRLFADGYSDGYLDGYLDNDGYSDGYYPKDGYQKGYSYDGITFMADDEHYVFDFGENDTTNRFSILKDGRGYLTFRIYDQGLPNGKKNNRSVSADISNWVAGEKHHIAVTWKLNSSDRRDEMHLFIDGTEVPNLMYYGGRPSGISTDRFRTVKPEIITGTISKKIIVGNDLATQAGSNIVSSASINFQSQGIIIGDTIEIREVGFGTYNIIAVNTFSLTLNSAAPTTFTDARFSINEFSSIVTSEIDLYNNIAVSVIHNDVETEIPGVRADIPAYAITKNFLNQNILTILGEADIGDQIAIRTLGMNHRRCRARQFVWGNTQNIIKSQLPPPISLDEAKITAILLPLVAIGPNNSTLTLGTFVSTLNPTQPTNLTEGRKLSVRMTAGNVIFPATVKINGTTAVGPIFETITFTKAETKITSNKFKTIISAVITVTPIVSTKNAVSVEITETYPITTSDGNNIYPVIRFSYKTQIGSGLQGTIGGSTVTDSDGFFVESNVDQSMVISTPSSVAGTYTITTRNSSTSVEISPTLPATFTNGKYDLYNISLGRSGFQNGFFVFERAGASSVSYPLPQGVYEFDFSSYMEAPFSPTSDLTCFVGSDFHGNKQIKAVLDEFRILSKVLTDVRVGESLSVGEDSITSNYSAIRPFESNSSTLVLLHFNSLPLKNYADYWITTTREFLQAGTSVNGNFGQSLVVATRPLIVENNGLFTTNSEGSIEFWVSPRFDTYNDPNNRFYFDASSSIVEDSKSLTSGTVLAQGRISSVLSVRLATDVNNTGINYFSGGTIASDFQTINLGRALPYQQTPIRINYIPSGISGNRLSIYKDREGFITFNVRSEGIDYQVRQPIFWQRDTWHRITASFKFNRLDNQDEMRLFVDGEERGVVTYGSGLLFGDGHIFGQGFAGVNGDKLIADIKFKDLINQFYIGSDYFGVHLAEARIDNLRLSDVARTPLIVAGQPKDINYSSNIDVVLPVVEDAFTTYLLNFDILLKKEDKFALVRDENFGIFDFTLNIFDSFGIVSSNAKIKQVLETLILALKPATSRATINYIDDL